MHKKKILILSYSDLRSDPRIQRQIHALKNDYLIDTCGFGGSGHSSIPFFQIYTLPPFSLKRKIKRLFQFLTRKFDDYYWDSGKKNIVLQLASKNYDVVIGNDIHTLPLAIALANKNAKVYFDAHEFHPKEFNENFKWRLLDKPFINYLCKTYIPKANVFSTVAEGIAQAYEKFLGIKPIIITNAKRYEELSPTIVDPVNIKIIHHGTAIRGRQLETMIEMMSYLKGHFQLDFMLVTNNNQYLDEIKQLASKYPNIHFIDPVSSGEICQKINSYDIGLYILQPTNFNNLHALPNKFFEFIQARLCIAIAPSPEMTAITRKYDLGVIAEDFSPQKLAEKLQQLTAEKIYYYKKQSHLHAKKLSDEENVNHIKNIIQGLIQDEPKYK